MILGYKGTHIVAMPPFEGVKTYATKDFEKNSIYTSKTQGAQAMHGCMVAPLYGSFI